MAALGTAVFRFHRAVINPDRKGCFLSLARAGLAPASAAYGLAVSTRNSFYRMGWARTRRASVPVISVGNITAGGTGKTPFVAWLARLMVIRQMRPAILSRGYGRHEVLGLDDENLMLSRLAGNVPIVVDADRLRGAEAAVRLHSANVLVLDDGFQHRGIGRDLDIVLIDALWPFGAEHLLPRGLLREPVWALRRAGFIVVTRADLVTAERLQEIVNRLREIAPGVPTACCANVIRGLRPLGSDGGEGLPPQALREGRWTAFCGIGNPEGFRLTLERAGCDVAVFCVFSDHQRYDGKQTRLLLRRAVGAGCDRVVTTEKDAVKVERLLEAPSRPPLYALQTELDLTAGSEALTAAILRAVAGHS